MERRVIGRPVVTEGGLNNAGFSEGLFYALDILLGYVPFGRCVSPPGFDECEVILGQSGFRRRELEILSVPRPIQEMKIHPQILVGSA